MIPETVRGGRAWGAGATLATELLLDEAPLELEEVLCEPVSPCEPAELLAFEAGASLEEGELTGDDLVALQATRFNPTTAQRNPRRAFLGRLNRIRTTYTIILT